MKKHFFLFVIFLLSLSLTSCFSEKNSPFYDSEWVMQNLDENADLYYHHLILSPGHKVMLRASYADSSNIIVWTGKYKINSKKISFNFTECTRYEKGQLVGQYTTGKLIKYYAGDFLYSVAMIDEDYRLQLIRPEGYFYRDFTDVFGNQLDEFIKVK